MTVTDIGVSRPTTPAAAAAPAPRAVIDYDFQSVLVAAPKQRLVLWLMAGLIVLAAIGLSVAQVDMIVAANGKVVTTDSQIVVQPFETSVVRSMAVKMGQKVKEGDVLATLDPTFWPILTAIDRTTEVSNGCTTICESEIGRASCRERV